MMRTIVRFLAATIAVLVVTAGSCNGDDPVAGEDSQVFDDTSLTQDQVTPPTTEPVATVEAAAGTSATAGGAFETVFGIPPFGNAQMQPGFGEYRTINNEFQCDESVFFEMTGADRDQVIAFYTDTLSAQGYVVGAPFPLGDSVAINLTMPDAPGVTAVVQVGPLSPTDPTLGVNQQRNELKQNPSDSTQGDPGGSSDSSVDGSSESSEN